jgi:hypothetical protein
MEIRALMLNIALMKKVTPFKESNISFVRNRLKEMTLSIREAERQACVPKDTIQKMLLGYGTDYENYVAVMKLIRYSVPLYGKLISGAGVQKLADSEEKSFVQLHEGVEYSPDMQAILVDDDRYEPRYFRGTLLYFKQTSINAPGSLTTKHPYVVKTRAMANPDLAIIRKGSREGVYNLLAIDGSASIIQDADLEWCAPIEGSRWEY